MRAQKPQCFYHSASMYKQQGVTRNNNKEEPYYFRLKDKTKLTNNKNDLRKKLIRTHKL